VDTVLYFEFPDQISLVRCHETTMMMRMNGDSLVLLLVAVAALRIQPIEVTAEKRSLRLHQEAATKKRVGGRQRKDPSDGEPSEIGWRQEWLNNFDVEGSMPPVPTPSSPTLSPISASEQPQNEPTTRPTSIVPSSAPATTTTYPTPGLVPTVVSPTVEPTESPSLVHVPTRRPTLLPTTPLPPITLIPVRRPTVVPTKVPSTELNLMETISQKPELETFQVVVTAVGLNENLASNDGVATVFGPPNSAFEVIGPEYLSAILTPSYNLQLVDLASYHILLGLSLRSANLFSGRQLTMLNKLNITVSRNAPGVFPEIQLITPAVEEGEAPIINVTEMVDIGATNGVLHEVDSVILPEWYFYNSLLEVLQSVPGTYGTLLAILEETGIEPKIAGLSASTLFGPSNQALSDLSKAVRDFLQLPENFNVTREIVEYHIIVDLIPFTELEDGDTMFDTLQGESVTVSKATDSNSAVTSVSINGVSVQSLALGRDSIAYEIDGVLVPPSLLSIVVAA